MTHPLALGSCSLFTYILALFISSHTHIEDEGSGSQIFIMLSNKAFLARNEASMGAEFLAKKALLDIII